ncbi:MAG: alpha/beta fold hydrolase, partial [Rubrivivax sp.]|nr:alpha/beta fold hydrolase [Rubrivivax sp.]
QAELLAEGGFGVVCIDTRGHGDSDAPPPPYAMADLVADTVAVLDALRITRAHLIGLSLGGMSALGLAIAHPQRLLSLLVCDARADMPGTMGVVWNERIASARQHGCAALADATCERWFGPAFVAAHPDIAQGVKERVAGTSVDGFVGCAQAIQGLDWIAGLGRITAPTTLLVGANDGPLPAAMQALQSLIPGARFELIADAGHLPHIDQTAAFNAALLRHLAPFAR